MDSKSQAPSSSYDEEPAPPPAYTDSLPTDHKLAPTYTPPANASQYYSSQIQHQLRDLTTTITTLQTQKSILSHAQDEKILSLLTHQIQIYLSDFANSGLEKGTLILVPRRGIEDENALPSQYDFKDPEHYDKVVRVSDKETSSFSEYGEEEGQLWFWNDEDMALRLAGYLKPVTNPRDLELPPRKEEIKMQQQASSSSSSRSFWSRKKDSYKTKEDRPPLIEEPSRDYKIEIPKANEDKVIMDVVAEEVVFRTENDFGLFETKRGWGIVLKLRVIMSRR